LNQKELDAAASAMQAFLFKLALIYNSNFHELKEITDRALGEVESGAAMH